MIRVRRPNCWTLMKDYVNYYITLKDYVNYRNTRKGNKIYMAK